MARRLDSKTLPTEIIEDLVVQRFKTTDAVKLEKDNQIAEVTRRVDLGWAAFGNLNPMSTKRVFCPC